MAKFVWVSRGIGQGDDAIDLHQCLRFVLSDPSVHKWADDLCVLYRVPDGRWIKHWSFMADLGPDGAEVLVGYEFVNPVEAAREIFMNFSKTLPPELEEHRAIVSDHQSYARWSFEHNREPESDQSKVGGNGEFFRSLPDPARPPIRPSWDRDLRLLVAGGVTSREFKREAPNQFMILDAFEEQGWPQSIPSPFDGEEILRQTIKDLNTSLNHDSPIRFRQENLRVAWKVISRRKP